MDLFTPIVPAERLHPNFVATQTDPYIRAVLTQWADGFSDRDGKFVREFQTTFDSSFWELYLFAVAKELAWAVDFGCHAPDFVVTGPTAFSLEATIASNAQGALPESNPISESPLPHDLNEFNRSAVLRLVNSISAKSKKYLESYCNLPHVRGKPFVLAVAPYDQPFAYLQVNRAIEATLYGYYVDEQSYLANPVSAGPVPTCQVESVKKTPDVSVPLGLFNDHTHAHISAVIFSSCATWGKVRALSDDPAPFTSFTAARADPRDGRLLTFRGPKRQYQESLLDGLRVYHNPNATLPMDWSVFRRPEVFQGMVIDQDEGQWLFEAEQPMLIFRIVLRLNALASNPTQTDSAAHGAGR
jgi:hypothetical protein